MIVVLHAYSSANAGDGLLVDATLRLLGDAGARLRDVHVVALAPASFAHLSSAGVTVAPAPAGQPRRPAVAAAHELLRQTPAFTRRRPAHTSLAALVAHADLIVGVGGGYLRSGSPMEAVKAAAAHLPQLLAATASNVPCVYLPQSVGPLRGPVGAAMRAALRRVDVVHVRDDRSRTELGPNVASVRTPDLAVLETAERIPNARAAAARQAGRGGPTVIVARQLHRSADYVRRLRLLAEAFPDAVWAVQSEGRGNNDRAFYQRMGLGQQHASLRHILAEHDPGVVISVRLHGALQSVMAGWPAVHLSYERKGFGAYDDLGIPELVHHAWRFDPERVAQQVSALHAAPETYWEALSHQAVGLRRQRAALVDVLRQRMPAGDPHPAQS